MGVVIVEEGVVLGCIWASHCNQCGLCSVVVRERRAFPSDFGEDLLYFEEKKTLKSHTHSVR